MSRTLESIRRLISEENVRVSEHGYDELAADGLLARELVEGVEAAEIIEDYPDYPKGRAFCCCNEPRMDGRSTQCGEFPQAMQVRQC